MTIVIKTKPGMAYYPDRADFGLHVPNSTVICLRTDPN